MDKRKFLVPTLARTVHFLLKSYTLYALLSEAYPTKTHLLDLGSSYFLSYRSFIRQLICHWCEEELLSIRHVLLECPVLQNVREEILQTALLDKYTTMENVIGESGVIRVLIYLWEIEIFEEI